MKNWSFKFVRSTVHNENITNLNPRNISPGQGWWTCKSPLPVPLAALKSHRQCRARRRSAALRPRDPPAHPKAPLYSYPPNQAIQNKMQSNSPFALVDHLQHTAAHLPRLACQRMPCENTTPDPDNKKASARQPFIFQESGLYASVVDLWRHHH